ncbi:hypothetical protein E2C01_079406 [Portunus trituberculatus]|uniref:Uncharacterized protein n=1 Tax=Portunus trituberculatus TaxID=210409 RepID=A0A5B7IGW0_PORTR|nr:hypothetical protein [Portunus trituberculatus]
MRNRGVVQRGSLGHSSSHEDSSPHASPHPSPHPYSASRTTVQQVRGAGTLSPFSTMTCFHIHSGYYLVILYSFRNLCGGLE